MSSLMNIGGGLYLPDMAAIYADNQQRRANDHAMERQRVTEQRADKLYNDRQSIGQAYANGDAAGARKIATTNADFDALAHLDTLDTNQRQRAVAEAEFIGRLAPALGQITDSNPANIDAKRREAARALLKNNLGMTDAQIDAQDFSDSGLSLANSAAMSIKDRLAERRADFEMQKPITAADGAVLQPDGKGSYTTIYTPGTKPLTQVVTDPVTGEVRVVNVPGQPGQSVNTGNPGRLGNGGFDAIDNGFTKPTEGGFVAKDGASGAPANYGINQRANPDIDVRNLTPDQAQQLRKTRYWDTSGAANMPTPAGQAVVYDTAINMGVAAAQRMVQETGGDPERMLQWRESRYRSIAQNPKQRGNLPTWLNRNSELRQYVGMASNQAAPVSNGPTVTNLGGGGDPVWQNDTRGGLQGQTNRRTGEFKAFPGQKAQAPQDIQAATDSIATADQTLRTLYDPTTGKTHPGFSASVGLKGLSGGLLGGWVIPGTDAADFQTQLETFKSQAFLQSVQQMRGLGALSDAEGQKLSAAIGNLSTSQSETQFRSNVGTVLGLLEKAKRRLATIRGGQNSGQSSGQPVRVSSPAQAAALPAGTRFVTPDGQVRVKH